jgi:hypothetical protein
MSRSRLAIALGSFVWLLNPASAFACAACFGRSDSSLAKGLNFGIWSLLAVVMFMWVAFGAFIVFLVKRSARISSTPSVSPVLAESTIATDQ